MIDRIINKVILIFFILSVIATVFFWWGSAGEYVNSSLDRSFIAILLVVAGLLGLWGLVRLYRNTNGLRKGFILALGVVMFLGFSYLFIYLVYISPKKYEERLLLKQDIEMQRVKDECETYKIEAQVERTDGQILVPPPGCI